MYMFLIWLHVFKSEVVPLRIFFDINFMGLFLDRKIKRLLNTVCVTDRLCLIVIILYVYFLFLVYHTIELLERLIKGCLRGPKTNFSLFYFGFTRLFTRGKIRCDIIKFVVCRIGYWIRT